MHIFNDDLKQKLLDLSEGFLLIYKYRMVGLYL